MCLLHPREARSVFARNFSGKLEKAGTVDFKKHPARKVGTRSRQCRPKVPGRFGHLDTKKEDAPKIKYFGAFRPALLGDLLSPRRRRILKATLTIVCVKCFEVFLLRCQKMRNFGSKLQLDNWQRGLFNNVYFLKTPENLEILTCVHAFFFPFCPLSWPPLFPFSRHIFALSPNRKVL